MTACISTGRSAQEARTAGIKGIACPTQSGDAEATGTGESGFTLIELLVVVVVLGLLASIVVLALASVPNQSTMATCESNARTVGLAIAAYEAQNPTTTQVVESDLTRPQGSALQTWPQSAHNEYSILIAGDGNAYVGTSDTDGHQIAANDVLVQTGTAIYDAMDSIAGACSSA